MTRPIDSREDAWPARAAKLVMVAALSVFGLLVAFNNVTDYRSNFLFVRHVLSMDTTFSGNRLMWRAISAEWAWHALYALIIAGEAATGVVFAVAAHAMARAFRGDGASFARAKRFVPLGTALGFLVWFFGFSVVGGEWFVMWQSPTWNGQQPAFRFFITMLAVCIYVMQDE